MFNHERQKATESTTVRITLRSATGLYHYARLTDRHVGVAHGVEYKPTRDVDAALEQFSRAGLFVETQGEFTVKGITQ